MADRGGSAGRLGDLHLLGQAFNLIAYSMTVGIFNLPRCAAVLGFVPFVFLVFAFQYMTWFTGMAYARLQRRYPGIHSVPDAVHLIYGETGRTIMAAFQLLFSIMLSGNHIILGSYAFHTLGWQCVDWHLHRLLRC